jgi:hypothetical protein
MTFWVAVDYATTFNPDFQRWLAYMPMVWLFYLGCAALFSLLIPEVLRCIYNGWLYTYHMIGFVF